MHTTTEIKAPAAVHQLSEARDRKQLQTRRRLLGLAEVEGRCRTKKSAIYAGMAAGTFPKCVRLPHSRSVAWLEADIDAWIDAVMAANGRSVVDQQTGDVAAGQAGDLASQGGAK